MSIEYGTIKYKIMVALILAGDYPYKSLDLMLESERRVRDCIIQLKEDGYIDIKRINEKRRIRLKMFHKRKKEYIKDMWEGAENYVPDIRSNGEHKLERKDRIAEVLMMMMESSINITPDKKPHPKHNEPISEQSIYLPYYITSLEARAAIAIKEDKGKGARFHGTLVSLGGMYNIYNMGKSMMEWIRPAERAAVDFVDEYTKKITPWGMDYREWYKNSAIIFSRNMEYIVDFVKGNVSPRHGKGVSKNLVNINDYYDNTFYLPLTREGQIMLHIMTKKDWHYYLVGLFYNDDVLAKESVKRMIACDGDKDGCYGLVFLDGNIGRLKRFVNINVTEEDKGKYKIICYDFQKEFVEKLAPPGMDVISYNFKMVTDGFFNIFEQFENDSSTSLYYEEQESIKDNNQDAVIDEERNFSGNTI